MVERAVRLAFKFRFVLGGLFVVAMVLFILALLPAFVDINKVQAKEIEPAPKTTQVIATDDPNVVAGGLSVASREIDRSVKNFGYAVNDSMKSVLLTAVKSGMQINSGAKVVGRSIGGGIVATARIFGGGLSAIGRAAGNSVLFVARLPGKAIGSVTRIHAVNHFIRPADHEPVPIIDPKSPALVAALEALPAEAPVENNPNTKKVVPQWPVRGQITTHFGVAHWPFQRTHTGMDISDGTAPGTTPVKPFRPGKVIKVVYAYSGLGNYVTLDHGNGVTSVYAHLHSISVKEGQQVGMDTVLGTQGTTGASTGTHLHFEIRVNGQAADPRQFISGLP